MAVRVQMASVTPPMLHPPRLCSVTRCSCPASRGASARTCRLHPSATYLAMPAIAPPLPKPEHAGGATPQSSTQRAPSPRRSASPTTGRRAPAATPHAAIRRQPARLHMPVRTAGASRAHVVRLLRRCNSPRSTASRQTSQRLCRQAAHGLRSLAAFNPAGSMAARGSAEPCSAFRRMRGPW